LVDSIKDVLKMRQLSFQLEVFHHLINQLFIKQITKKHLVQVKKDSFKNKMHQLSIQIIMMILVHYKRGKVIIK
jgi:hypothetical protein